MDISINKSMNINLGMKSHLWKPLKSTCLELTASELAFLGAGLKYVCKCVCVYMFLFIHTHTDVYISCSVVSDSLKPHGLWTTRFLCPWDFLARILEWVAIAFSRASWPRGQTLVSCIGRQILTIWATREASVYVCVCINKNIHTHRVQFSCSVISDSAALWTAARQASMPVPTPRTYSNSCPSSQWCHPTISYSLCHPLLHLPSIFPSITVFFSKSALHIRWPKYWSFSFSISPSSVYSGLISFTTDWCDLLALQGTIKSLLQHHSAKTSNSLVLSFLYCPILTSIHDYWKKPYLWLDRPLSAK